MISPLKPILGTSLYETRRYLVEKTDKRRESLMSFMLENDFVLLNGRRRSDTPAKFTSNRTANTFDLVWASLDITELVLDSQVTSELLGSNHLPVSSILADHVVRLLPATPDAPGSPSSRPTTAPLASELSLLWKHPLQKDYVALLEKSPRLQVTASVHSIDQLNVNLLAGIREVALNLAMSKSISRSGNRRNTHPKPPWFDSELHNIIPEDQAGFRQKRGAMDNIFILTSIVHNRLRLPGGRVYSLFVDFRRAFDSVPHHLLWQKLLKLGLSSKVIRVVKNLYDRATIRIRTSEGYTEDFNVSEGVLRGEKMSPLLFNLYLADIENFFRVKGARGVDIDGRKDVILLLYADDLIILAFSSIDLKLKLRILEEYCSDNGLTINIGKTKVMIFRKGGRLPSANHAFQLNGNPVEIVTEYTYLGVKFTSTATGRAASAAAASRSRVASSAVLRLLSSIGADSWEGTKRLHSSIVTSTLLYPSSLWALRHLPVLEAAHLSFFKRLFNLPRYTPGYSIRLETGIHGVSLEVIKQALLWIVKVLNMSDSRLPKLREAMEL
ncbi:uncharacterized protein LOC114841493 [Diachasma alloeum]|uniref:uncharacterized protein LOC114841493 n=1 Tax=Diachasma alloeum TaxID=454923 RepID=UPI0010FB1600|nr:uncharacterized protein LOC114841493 [Diachasma alloeum]